MLELISHLQFIISSLNGWITQTLHGNIIVAGAVTASIAGSLFYILRKLPAHAWMYFKRYTLFTYDIEYDLRDDKSMINEIALKFEYELQKRVSGKRPSARLTTHKKKLVESLSDGAFYFIYQKAIIRVSRRKEVHPGEKGNSSNSSFKITLSLTSLRFHRKIILAMLNESSKEYMVPGVYQMAPSIYMSEGPNARRVRNFTNIPVLAIDDRVKEIIDEAIDNFLANRKYNNANDKSHKLVFLFYGEPGTGKSSLAEYIAFYLKTSLFCVNGSSINGPYGVDISGSVDVARANISDDEIPTILYDDVDTIWEGIRKRSSKVKNVLPGVSASEEEEEFYDNKALGRILTALQSPVEVNDCVLMFTTNHLEKIDPAVYRPGRVTVLLEIGRMSPKSIQQYFNMSYGLEWPAHTPIERMLRGCDVSSIYEANVNNPQGFIEAIISNEISTDEAFLQKKENVTT